ncbi:MAG: hypothetical protein A2900_05690 [Candidatus Chisholmbacteria bacterium RIFCSPLOWO2_01_FULL_50_28]|uniref:Uncharacterized protein n=1 Tax=Candidatus Chisholmbacteria bacterium RIFCSPHIGHO2_01_FULL_52_32 TaxID=1797591 RepID=A0A1G1VS05_9BACT|nr:MAG: hypothetical protein A2786_01055 [Candidatus Chisholmbacteria bacterium RIFCSPHIGHO2_01_FULL_52_32]OGY20533.1 MAG: hypothetical protein A2900_05690 [Candidatus Chisholmbacteria bacterium RIFCSPLOWO2_01_FULL_50_28]
MSSTGQVTCPQSHWAPGPLEALNPLKVPRVKREEDVEMATQPSEKALQLGCFYMGVGTLGITLALYLAVLIIGNTYKDQIDAFLSPVTAPIDTSVDSALRCVSSFSGDTCTFEKLGGLVSVLVVVGVGFLAFGYWVSREERKAENLSDQRPNSQS